MHGTTHLTAVRFSVLSVVDRRVWCLVHEETEKKTGAALCNPRTATVLYRVVVASHTITVRAHALTASGGSCRGLNTFLHLPN